jgi:alpha-glucosidase
VTARRKGKTWYLGGLSARGPRELDLPLSFLGTWRYTLKIWKDATDTEANPNRLATESLRVSSSERLKVRVAPDGGFVAQLTPTTRGINSRADSRDLGGKQQRSHGSNCASD